MITPGWTGLDLWLEGSLFTGLFSMLPFVELRAGLPLGYALYDLPLWLATVSAIVGNGLVAASMVYIAPPLVEWFRQHADWIDKLVEKIFAKTRAEHSKKLQIWGDIALVVLVAIPLPGSGGWTGALVAYLFGIKRPLAVGLIVLGVAISGLVVAGLTAGGVGLWEYFFG